MDMGMLYDDIAHEEMQPSVHQHSAARCGPQSAPAPGHDNTPPARAASAPPRAQRSVQHPPSLVRGMITHITQAD